MSTTQHTIELNGKIYDARTGKLLRNDGAANHKQAAEKTHPTNHTKKPHTSAHIVHQKTQRTKTLMRHAVKKPETRAGNTKPASVVTAHSQLDQKRLHRATQIRRSKHISKFGNGTAALKPKTAILPVQPEPELAESVSATPPAFSFLNHRTRSVHQPRHSRPDFDKAIQQATGHTEKHVKRTKKHNAVSRTLNISPRHVNFAGVSLAILLLAGFFAWQHAPNLSVQLASSRAGVNGSAPDYQPSGFSLSGPIRYYPGQVILTYESRTDSRNFRISQRASSWNEENLRQHYLTANSLEYQTVKDNGKTIYIYDNQNATWVDNGVWYQIEGNSSLASDQLLRLASSL